MFKWVQGGLSAVTGIAEPEYGPDYIHSVTDSVRDSQPFSKATLEDFHWVAPNFTNVETQTFYFTDLEKGLLGFAQVIHSNVVGIHTTAQFTFKVFNTKTGKQTWTSTKLEDFVIKGENFYAKDLKIEYDDASRSFHVVSNVNEDSIVDLTFVRVVEPTKIGKDGTTYYGDDVENPWGIMRHVFWPRNKVTGSIKTAQETFEIDGYSMFVMAIQGMKPHHAAATWNFLNYHSKDHSVVVMEFTTPKSYATTKVSVAIISNNEKVIATSIDNEVIHEKTHVDEEIGWPEPNAITFKLNGIDTAATDEEIKSQTFKKFNTKVSGDLTLIERVDVMNEIPTFVKNIVSGVVGTKPYIYQYWNPMTLEINDDIKETSTGYVETTFISEI